MSQQDPNSFNFNQRRRWRIPWSWWPIPAGITLILAACSLILTQATWPRPSTDPEPTRTTVAEARATEVAQQPTATHTPPTRLTPFATGEPLERSLLEPDETDLTFEEKTDLTGRLATAKQYANRARVHFLAQRHAWALADYNQALSFPDSNAYYSDRADVYLRLAIYTMTLAEPYPGDPTAEELLALAEADFLAAQAATGEATNARALAGLSYVYYFQEDLDKADAFSRQAMGVDPTIGRIYYVRGLLMQRNQEMRSALDFFTSAIKTEPNADDIYYFYVQQGSTYYDLGDMEEAWQAFRQLDKLIPPLEVANGNNWFLITVQQATYDALIESGNRNVLESPTAVPTTIATIDITSKYANTQYQNGNKQEAFEIYNTLIQLYGNDHHHEKRSDILMEWRRFEEAETGYRQSLELSSVDQNPRILIKLAESQVWLGQLEKAQENLTVAESKLETVDSHALYVRGLLAERAGDIEQAYSLYLQAEQIGLGRFQNAQADLKLSLLQIIYSDNLARIKQSLREAERNRNLFEPQELYQLEVSLAVVNYREALYEEAILHFNQASEYGELEGYEQAIQAYAYQHLDQHELFVRTLTNAIEQAPNNPSFSFVLMHYQLLADDLNPSLMVNENVVNERATADSINQRSIFLTLLNDQIAINANNKNRLIALYELRAIVHTQLGEFERASADIETYIIFAKEQEGSRLYPEQLPLAWLVELAGNNNPFTPSVLSDIRAEYLQVDPMPAQLMDEWSQIRVQKWIENGRIE